MKWYKLKLCFLIFLTVLNSDAQTQHIRMSVCEGEMPADFKKQLDTFVGKPATDFSKLSRLGVYNILNSGQVLYGNAMNRYVDSVGKLILERNGIAEPVRFYILRSALYNAFATDEGYIFTSTALLAQAKGMEELAYVLCHEISHYLLKHNLKRYEQQMELAVKAFGNRKRGKDEAKDKKRFVESSSLDAYLSQYYLYARNQELQADSMGLQLYRNCGFNETLVTPVIQDLQYENPLFNRDSFSIVSLVSPQYPMPLSLQKRKTGLNELLEAFSDDYIASGKRTTSASEYSTHPEWQDRLKALQKHLLPASNAVFTPLPSDIRFSALSELLYACLINRKYVHALTLLTIMEAQYEIDNAIGYRALIFHGLRYAYPGPQSQFADKHNKAVSDCILLMGKGFAETASTWLTAEAIRKGQSNATNDRYASLIVNDSTPAAEAPRRSYSNAEASRISEDVAVWYKLIKSALNDRFEMPAIGKRSSRFSEHQVGFSSDGELSYNGPPFHKTPVDSMFLFSPRVLHYKHVNDEKGSDQASNEVRSRYLQNRLLQSAGDFNLNYFSVDNLNKSVYSTEAYNASYLLNAAFFAAITRVPGELSVLLIEAGALSRNTSVSKVSFVMVISENRDDIPSSIKWIFPPLVYPYALFGVVDMSLFFNLSNSVNAYNLVLDLNSFDILMANSFNFLIKLNNSASESLARSINYQLKSFLYDSRTQP